MTPMAGTLQWCAPEVLNGGKYTEKQMFTGKKMMIIVTILIQRVILKALV